MSFLRVSRRKACPICGKPDWCLVASDGTAAICARIESPKPVGLAGAGWLHVLDDRRDRMPVRQFRVPVPASKPVADWSSIAVDCIRAATPEAIDGLATSLGLSADSLRRLNIGWHLATTSFSFVMKDDAGRVVGIRLRRPTGFKFAISGSRQGLFLPYGIRLDMPLASTLYVTEGPTDCAALLDMGLAAVGRPSCSGGVDLIVRLVRRLLPPQVVVVADRDDAGIRGAESLAAAIVTIVPVRIITPPDGIKDARAWLRAGATAAEVMSAVDLSPPRKLKATLTVR